MTDPASDCSGAFLNIPEIMCDWFNVSTEEEGRTNAQKIANEMGKVIILLRNADGVFYFALAGSGGFERAKKQLIEFNFVQIATYEPVK
ncbi:TPA: hypothetical protein DHW62_02335 [candidate division WWE3 bacterium]|uniref:Uncharacterized protein n=1 Tax=candidate division WWE3 bacterium TaxID=2053526 RepID=A0A656PQ41_UNCKA|nr:hypothetical protein P147_WWE3C00001G0735 [candidate division WWE3 bacterium RAAC2_WWE3_1]KKS29199.1 MAG: hypothetical protein UU91_C0008G0063 [candidate division WWE3 bacterium GW2011_GWB1_42_117]KKS54735.1 MAG: hypothetical protein UV21_C0005G0099 [candidate division WWE3 bacterium GW2011_GWD2_42_34]KKT04491.1 MAG: hypothetical protein UV83_C0012G0011 [candidate division WWE3 bacterium GW2011_GWE2_43_18]KKT06174.1 MAG: hypothetical protein UV84_C0012G0010 [candidate division WWE3 bacterium